ncbi:hypothetical protein BKA56DRAFT_231220 [Ilyonectria sp. MPI-CAGE-AT-0026]|nr:hypothetical protein BKA56DRAFT_231220 [Ilyonectria sp. MPI-CAGE-AT-0026]
MQRQNGLTTLIVVPSSRFRLAPVTHTENPKSFSSLPPSQKPKESLPIGYTPSVRRLCSDSAIPREPRGAGSKDGWSWDCQLGRPLSWTDAGVSWQDSCERQLVLAPVDKGLARPRVLLQAVHRPWPHRRTGWATT